MFESWTAKNGKITYFSFHVSRLTLDTFVADNFPLKSTEFVKGGPQYNDYIHALEKVHAFYKGCC